MGLQLAVSVVGTSALVAAANCAVELMKTYYQKQHAEAIMKRARDKAGLEEQDAAADESQQPQQKIEPRNTLPGTQQAPGMSSQGGTALKLISDSNTSAPANSQLLADMQACLDQSMPGAAAAAVMRESALQQLARIMGHDFSEQLRACTAASKAAASYRYHEYVSRCTVQAVGVKVRPAVYKLL